MDRLEGALGVVARFLVRVGVPIAIPLLIGYLLKRLDARWEAEEKARQASAPALPARPPCWEIKGCSAEARAQCPAFQARPEPCWVAFQHAQGRVPERCFTCEVFVNA